MSQILVLQPADLQLPRVLDADSNLHVVCRLRGKCSPKEFNVLMVYVTPIRPAGYLSRQGVVRVLLRGSLPEAAVREQVRPHLFARAHPARRPRHGRSLLLELRRRRRVRSELGQMRGSGQWSTQ